MNEAEYHSSVIQPLDLMIWYREQQPLSHAHASYGVYVTGNACF